MTLLSQSRPKFARSSMVVVSLLLLTGAQAALAAPISGVVTNKTTGKPAAGDTVALIRLQQGMQVADHTTTDTAGHYTLDVTDGDAMHLVRVTHQGASYFQAAPPGKSTVDVDVYDAAEKVEGVTTEADVLRMETDQDGLRVTENYFVKNASSPPRTQVGPKPYEIHLPKDAQIVSAAALGPGSMPVQSSPIPLGPPGDYTFVFPLRPGETRFQVLYKLPYSGSFQFKPRFSGPVDNFALILPKSMKFAGTPTAAFQAVDEDVNAQTYLSRNVTSSTSLSFVVSGTGQLPQETAAAQGSAGNNSAAAANPEAAAQAAAVNNRRPGIGLGVPLDTPDPLHKYKWWIISVAVILLAIGAGISMKRPNPPADAALVPVTPDPLSRAPGTLPAANVGVSTSNPTTHRAMLLEALKEELFQLEADRIAGRMSPEEYQQQKRALETVLKRALSREPVNGKSTIA